MIVANKNPLGPEEAWELLRAAREVVIAQGKKINAYTPTPEHKSTILAEAIGRSGKLRAPALRLGEIFYIGFNAEMYEKLGS